MIRKWLRSKARLIQENKALITRLDMARHLILTCPTIEELRKIQEGSTDLFQEVKWTLNEKLELRSWIVNFILLAFKDLINDFEGAENYLEMRLGNEWEGLTVLIQRHGSDKLTPAQKAIKVQKENVQLRQQITRLQETIADIEKNMPGW